MPTFNYKAITPQGQVVKNKIVDSSKTNCVKKLKRNGLTPVSISQAVTVTTTNNKPQKNKKRDQPAFNSELATATIASRRKKKKLNTEIQLFKQKVTHRDIRIFAQNFYLLKKAQFNNIHALSTVIETTENKDFVPILEDILAGVEAGEFMYTTMEYYEDVFPYIFINMVKVGELSGSLENSLQQGVKYLEESDALNKKLRKILLPNILMFVGILAMLLVGVIVGVPMLQGIFDSIGTQDELPAITMWFSRIVDKLIQFWYIPTVTIIGALISFFAYIATPRGRYNFDYFKYTMPIFGKLIYLIDFSRLMKAVLLNLENGMRIQDSLEVSKNVMKNTVMLSLIETAINNIYIGKSWIEPFENAKLSSAMATEMLRIGMQTDLTEMVAKLLIYMEQDIDNTMEKIMKVLPEISYAIVGIVLVFFVIVVLVPCIQVYMGGFLFSAYGF